MLMRQRHPQLQFTHNLPYGAIIHDGGVQFVVFSRSATAMRLLLYNNVNDTEPDEVVAFDRDTDRWGDVWSISVPGIGAGQLYRFPPALPGRSACRQRALLARRSPFRARPVSRGSGKLSDRLYGTQGRTEGAGLAAQARHVAEPVAAKGRGLLHLPAAGQGISACQPQRS